LVCKCFFVDWGNFVLAWRGCCSWFKLIVVFCTLLILKLNAWYGLLTSCFKTLSVLCIWAEIIDFMMDLHNWFASCCVMCSNQAKKTSIANSLRFSKTKKKMQKRLRKG
jgi:hypothetical protein